MIYNADKFEAASRAKPVLLRSDEFMGPEATELPAEMSVGKANSGYLTDRRWIATTNRSRYMPIYLHPHPFP